MLIDGERQLYSAYGMPRADWWSLANPIAIWKYVVNIVSGNFPGAKGKDIRQMGGNVLIDPNGKIALAHVSSNPHDRPSCIEIFELAEA